MDHPEPADHHRHLQHRVRRHGQHAYRWRARLFVLHGGQHGLDFFCKLRQQHGQHLCDELADLRQGLLPPPDDAGQSGADQPDQLWHSGGDVPDFLGVVFCHRQRRGLYAVGAGGAFCHSGGHAARPRCRHHRILVDDKIP